MTEKYRPSNGAEGDYFMAEWCEQCEKDDPENNVLCLLLGHNSFWYCFWMGTWLVRI